ncbi:MAG: arylesterase [Gammaproteobacteria bacterium]|jgi:acyl-CoA thioesterase-1
MKLSLSQQIRLSAAALMLACLVLASRAAIADSTYTLMVYGDSLSAAYGIDESEGWVELLKSRLRSDGYTYEVVNGSVSGETTTGGLSRLPAMLDSYQPDLVILELGGNDGLRGLPLSAIRDNLVGMVTMSRESGADVLLAGIQIPPNYGPRYTEPFFAQYSQIADELNLDLVPFLIDGIPQQPELMQDDGIHPKAEAQQMILDNVWPVLQPMLKK